MMLDLSPFPRIPLLGGPTPIQPLDGLARHLGDALNGVRLFVKRDDLGPVGGGGNKLRKLEFLLGQARADGADTVITVGALQSNHARLTAAAAARCGFACELFLTRSVPREDSDYIGNGNRLLHELFGATVHLLAGDADSFEAAQARAEALRAEGRRVAVFPSGGSSTVGCLGYAACAAEIVDQSRQMGIDFADIVVPNGSHGTHAGLVAGLKAMGRDPTLVKAHTVLAPVEAAQAGTLETARASLALLAPDATLSPDDIRIEGNARGEGYGLPTAGMREAVDLMARTEGLLLDPVYSGKAFAGLLADIRSGRYRAGDAVLFVMTGGVPGLFAYRSEFGPR